MYNQDFNQVMVDMVDSHFGGKSPLEHLKEARLKGIEASREDHGSEVPGHLSACADAAKETALALSLLWALFHLMGIKDIVLPLLLFSSGWFIWKIGRSAILGWSRLERVNKLMREEKKEIETNREEEREELKELYRLKGFEGELLDRVIDVLMADDNKLLQVMLEEELGVTLESCEHPLKQALGAGIGVLVAIVILFFGHLFSKNYGLPLAALLIAAIASYIVSKIEGLKKTSSIIWQMALLTLAFLSTYYLGEFFLGGIK